MNKSRQSAILARREEKRRETDCKDGVGSELSEIQMGLGRSTYALTWWHEDSVLFLLKRWKLNDR